MENQIGFGDAAVRRFGPGPHNAPRPADFAGTPLTPVSAALAATAPPQTRPTRHRSGLRPFAPDQHLPQPHGPQRQVPPQRPPLPPHARQGRSAWTDPAGHATFVVLLTAAIWARGGGMAELGKGAAGWWLAVGQIAGLAAALGALAGLVLVARPRWLEQRSGLDRMVGWHRIAGIATVFGLLGHAIASTVGFAGGSVTAAPAELWRLMADEPWMVAAVASALLFAAVSVTSWRRLKSKMHYETWYLLHLNGYLAVALGFGHQILLGQTFNSDPIARWYWISLYAAVAAIVAYSRLGGILVSLFSPQIRVASVTAVAPGTVAIRLGGPGVARFGAKGGQFVSARFATSELWWQSHPFSISEAHPTSIRLTVKALGDATAAMQTLRVGTRVFLQGPYGCMSVSAEPDRPLVLIGAGVGLAPMVALLRDSGPGRRPIVLARAHTRAEVPHLAELRGLVEQRGGKLWVITGPRSQWKSGNPFTEDLLRRAIPDIAQRAAFVCGPPALQSAAESGLRRAGVPIDHIHSERFGW